MLFPLHPRILVRRLAQDDVVGFRTLVSNDWAVGRGVGQPDNPHVTSDLGNRRHMCAGTTVVRMLPPLVPHRVSTKLSTVTVQADTSIKDRRE